MLKMKFFILLYLISCKYYSGVLTLNKSSDSLIYGSVKEYVLANSHIVKQIKKYFGKKLLKKGAILIVDSGYTKILDYGFHLKAYANKNNSDSVYLKARNLFADKDSKRCYYNSNSSNANGTIMIWFSCRKDDMLFAEVSAIVESADSKNAKTSLKKLLFIFKISPTTQKVLEYRAMEYYVAPIDKILD